MGRDTFLLQLLSTTPPLAPPLLLHLVHVIFSIAVALVNINDRKIEREEEFVSEMENGRSRNSKRAQFSRKNREIIFQTDAACCVATKKSIYMSTHFL